MHIIQARWKHQAPIIPSEWKIKVSQYPHGCFNFISVTPTVCINHSPSVTPHDSFEVDLQLWCSFVANYARNLCLSSWLIPFHKRFDFSIDRHLGMVHCGSVWHGFHKDLRPDLATKAPKGQAPFASKPFFLGAVVVVGATCICIWKYFWVGFFKSTWNYYNVIPGSTCRRNGPRLSWRDCQSAVGICILGEIPLPNLVNETIAALNFNGWMIEYGTRTCPKRNISLANKARQNGL